MNTGENDRELNNDELNQVTGGGPAAHNPYLGLPVSISGATYDNPTPVIQSLNYPFPLPILPR
jgi:bacteriocin-like protein